MLRKPILINASLALMLLVFCGLPSASAQVEVVPRQIYVLHGGVDAVWGQLMFMVQNQSQQPVAGQFKIGLPTETTDWQGGEGFDKKMFTLSESGGVEFKKTFKPGSNIHTMNFKTEASGGALKLSIPIHFDLREFSILSKDLQVSGPGVTINKRSESEKFDRFVFNDLKKGETLNLEITGVQQGRGLFWIYGWAAFALMVCFGLGLAYRSRPKLT